MDPSEEMFLINNIKWSHLFDPHAKIVNADLCQVDFITISATSLP